MSITKSARNMFLSKESQFFCPKCKQRMYAYISFLAPTYQTYMCKKCGGIFYDLVDESKLEDVVRNAARYQRTNLDQ